MDAAEREMLEATVRDAIAEAPDGAAVDDALRALGWAEMLEAEPRDAPGIVFTALGALNASATALDDVVLRALGREVRVGTAVLLPSFAHWDPPGTAGITTARSRSADEIVVVTRDRDETSCAVVPTEAVDLMPVHGIDPALGLSVARLDTPADGVVTIDTETWDLAVADARRALSHQIAGACRAMLSLARTHAVERVQFGRPIAGFQAVRHRLAEALVAVEALEASVAAADDAPGAVTGAATKVVVGRTARTVAAHCQQVLAGTGFTTEHPFHRFLKRTMALDGIFGSADAIAVDLGHQLLATRTVPTLIEL